MMGVALKTFQWISEEVGRISTRLPMEEKVFNLLKTFILRSDEKIIEEERFLPGNLQYGEAFEISSLQLMMIRQFGGDAKEKDRILDKRVAYLEKALQKFTKKIEEEYKKSTDALKKDFSFQLLSTSSSGDSEEKK